MFLSIFATAVSLSLYGAIFNQHFCVFLLKTHYEAKPCILCIVSGIRNRPKSDLSRIRIIASFL